MLDAGAAMTQEERKTEIGPPQKMTFPRATVRVRDWEAAVFWVPANKRPVRVHSGIMPVSKIKRDAGLPTVP